MQAGDIVAAIDLGTSRTAYAYTVVGREHIWLGVPDSPDDDRNVSGLERFFKKLSYPYLAYFLAGVVGVCLSRE